jgi:hypothetical protein
MDAAKRVFLQKEDVIPHPESNSDKNYKIEICGKSYDFSQEMVDKYPKLLLPEARYTINFESILPLIYEYPVSCIEPRLIDESHEKTLFLSNCEWLGISLSNEVILHLNRESKKEIEEAHKFIRAQTGKKGKKKIRFALDQEVQLFCERHAEAHAEIYQDLKPIDIVRMLEIGDSALDSLTLHDWKGKNCVRSFIKVFTEFFLPKRS